MTSPNYTTATHTGPKPEKQGLASLEEVERASERLEGVVKRTPMDSSSTFEELSGADSVGLKLENFQRTGAFKLRGAYNRLVQMPEEQKQRGVIAASSGNHAQGVALAAEELGVDATIVMPQGTPEAKLQATAGYGAEVVEHGEVYDDSYEKAKELQQDQGLEFVHPYNDREVIAGQGTLGLEMLEQFPRLDTVFVAVGGGGLVSGVAAALKSLKPDVEVYGVQTEGCGTARETLEQGDVYHRETTDTIAGGIETKHVGELPARHFQEHLDGVVYVSDDETAAAMKLLAERQKTVAEPAGAVAAAATLFAESHGLDMSGRNVAVPVCGGNVDLEDFSRYCDRGEKFLERTGKI